MGGVRNGLERRPEWRMSQLNNDLFRNPDQLCLEQLDRIAAAARRDELRELSGHALRRTWNIIGDYERCFVQRQLRDTEPTSCSLECEVGTR